MHRRSSAGRFAFVVPSLNETAAQNEDIVQILYSPPPNLHRLWRMLVIKRHGDDYLRRTYTRGWNRLATLFPETVLPLISVEVLDEPAIPNLAAPASHKPAYNLFEWQKSATSTGFTAWIGMV